MRNKYGEYGWEFSDEAEEDYEVAKEIIVKQLNIPDKIYAKASVIFV